MANDLLAEQLILSQSPLHRANVATGKILQRPLVGEHTPPELALQAPELARMMAANKMTAYDLTPQAEVQDAIMMAKFLKENGLPGYEDIPVLGDVTPPPGLKLAAGALGAVPPLVYMMAGMPGLRPKPDMPTPKRSAGIQDGAVGYHGTPHKFKAATVVRNKTTGKQYTIDGGIEDHPVTRANPENYEVLSYHPAGKFRTDKIGTGEGAQAYGHGLYFAESPDVAKAYSRVVSDKGGWDVGNAPPRAQLSEKSLNRIKDTANFANIEARYFRDGPEAAKQMAKEAFDNSRGTPYSDAFHELAYKVDWEKSPGSFYEVDIPDSAIDNMLDWDKPLTEQPESVRKALETAWVSRGGSLEGREFAPWAAHSNATGQDAYAAMSTSFGSEKAASDYLSSKGIKGLKYYDQQSRSPSGNLSLSVRWGPNDETAEVFDTATNKAVKQFPTFAEADKWVSSKADEAGRTRNLVVFDENLPTIKSVNDKPIAPAPQNEREFSNITK